MEQVKDDPSNREGTIGKSRPRSAGTSHKFGSESWLETKYLDDHKHRGNRILDAMLKLF